MRQQLRELLGSEIALGKFCRDDRTAIAGNVLVVGVNQLTSRVPRAALQYVVGATLELDDPDELDARGLGLRAIEVLVQGFDGIAVEPELADVG